MSQSPAHVSTAHAPEEPKSPLWLPALGGALFLAVGLWWAVTPSTPDPMDAAPAVSAAPPPPPVVNAPPPQARPMAPPNGSAPPVRMGARGPGGGPGGGPTGSADPAAIQRLLEQMKKH